jgi:DNA-binding CsgD family transcriptional regulator
VGARGTPRRRRLFDAPSPKKQTDFVYAGNKVSTLPGISDDVLARANLTPRQLDAVRLYAGDAGYKRVAAALDISRDGARHLVKTGLRKLERAMRSEPVKITHR